jgi:hypothetical protein
MGKDFAFQATLNRSESIVDPSLDPAINLITPSQADSFPVNREVKYEARDFGRLDPALLPSVVMPDSATICQGRTSGMYAD